METDEKNLINQMYDRASVTVHMPQKRVSITHRSCMNGEKKVFLISLQKAVGQYKLGIGPSTLSFFITPLVSRKVTFLCQMQFFDFMQKNYEKVP
jgi:hypothetical protein